MPPRRKSRRGMAGRLAMSKNRRVGFDGLSEHGSSQLDDDMEEEDQMSKGDASESGLEGASQRSSNKRLREEEEDAGDATDGNGTYEEGGEEEGAGGDPASGAGQQRAGTGRRPRGSSGEGSSIRASPDGDSAALPASGGPASHPATALAPANLAISPNRQQGAAHGASEPGAATGVAGASGRSPASRLGTQSQLARSSPGPGEQGQAVAMTRAMAMPPPPALERSAYGAMGLLDEEDDDDEGMGGAGEAGKGLRGGRGALRGALVKRGRGGAVVFNRGGSTRGGRGGGVGRSAGLGAAAVPAGGGAVRKAVEPRRPQHLPLTLWPPPSVTLPSTARNTEMTVVADGCGDWALEYSLAAVADSGSDYWEWTSYSLKSHTYYFETPLEPYRCCPADQSPNPRPPSAPLRRSLALGAGPTSTPAPDVPAAGDLVALVSAPASQPFRRLVASVVRQLPPAPSPPTPAPGPQAPRHGSSSSLAHRGRTISTSPLFGQQATRTATRTSYSTVTDAALGESGTVRRIAEAQLSAAAAAEAAAQASAASSGRSSRSSAAASELAAATTALSDAKKALEVAIAVESFTQAQHAAAAAARSDAPALPAPKVRCTQSPTVLLPTYFSTRFPATTPTVQLVRRFELTRESAVGPLGFDTYAWSEVLDPLAWNVTRVRAFGAPLRPVASTPALFVSSASSAAGAAVSSLPAAAAPEATRKGRGRHSSSSSPPRASPSSRPAAGAAAPPAFQLAASGGSAPEAAAAVAPTFICATAPLSLFQPPSSSPSAEHTAVSVGAKHSGGSKLAAPSAASASSSSGTFPCLPCVVPMFSGLDWSELQWGEQGVSVRGAFFRLSSLRAQRNSAGGTTSGLPAAAGGAAVPSVPASYSPAPILTLPSTIAAPGGRASRHAAAAASSSSSSAALGSTAPPSPTTSAPRRGRGISSEGVSVPAAFAAGRRYRRSVIFPREVRALPLGSMEAEACGMAGWVECRVRYVPAGAPAAGGGGAAGAR